MLAIVALWFVVSLPLAYAGAFIALRHGLVSEEHDFALARRTLMKLYESGL